MYKRQYADRPEGDLTRIRASLVSEGALFQFAQEIDLGEYLRLGRGEERCGCLLYTSSTRRRRPVLPGRTLCPAVRGLAV